MELTFRLISPTVMQAQIIFLLLRLRGRRWRDAPDEGLFERWSVGLALTRPSGTLSDGFATGEGKTFGCDALGELGWERNTQE